MKYIFYVHSNITWYITKAIIDKLNIASEFIIILTARNTKINSNLNAIDVSHLNLNKKINIFDKIKLIEKAKLFVSELSSSNYLLYFPHHNIRFCQLLIKNPLCLGYNYIEEGLLGYWSKQEIRHVLKCNRIKFLFKYISEIIIYRKFIYYRCNFFDTKNPKYKYAYCFSKDCFTYLPNSIILPYDPTFEPINFDIKNLLVFSAEVEYNLISLDENINILNKLFTYFKKIGITQIHFKYHPAQRNNPIHLESIKSLMNKYSNIIFIELPSNFSLESFVSKNRSNIYIFLSSIVVYALISNRNVYSYINFASEKIKENYRSKPPFPRSIVEKIKFIDTIS